MLIAVSIGLAVGLYLVLFFAVLHLVDGLSASRPERGTTDGGEGS